MNQKFVYLLSFTCVALFNASFAAQQSAFTRRLNALTTQRRRSFASLREKMSSSVQNPEVCDARKFNG